LHSFSLAFNELEKSPNSRQLEHVKEIRSSCRSPGPSDTSNSESEIDHQPPLLISDGLPPVPARLANRVKQGLFIEMTELLPDYLSSTDVNLKDRPSSSKSKLEKVKNIIDWIQCFGIYIALFSRSAPERVAGLVGYQSLIISASQHNHEGHWVLYDRRFRLKASASKIKKWSVIDITIRNSIPRPCLSFQTSLTTWLTPMEEF